jgi:tRNA modification GTPase
MLDCGFAVYMKAPRSYTGEDVVEISVHSSLPVLQRILALAVDFGARLAERGEFTKRAFLNGKIDLAQAEAVLDLVRASTGLGASLAISQAGGALSKEIRRIRGRLLNVLAEVEVALDFPEEIFSVGQRGAREEIKKAQKEIAGLLATAEAGRIIKEGALVAIVGRPNVGKSSLLNALLREERAIVADEPGTTRDTVEEGLSVRGLPIRIVDTAGLRIPRGQAEKLGVARAHRAAEDADLILLVVDLSEPAKTKDKELLQRYRGKRVLVVLNKMDKPCRLNLAKDFSSVSESKKIRVSALLGRGIDRLEQKMYKTLLGKKTSDIGKVLINSRHRQCLSRAAKELFLAENSFKKGAPPDLITINLKEASAALGEVSGEVVSEEVLGKIFSEFCVGK